MLMEPSTLNRLDDGTALWEKVKGGTTWAVGYSRRCYIYFTAL